MGKSNFLSRAWYVLWNLIIGVWPIAVLLILALIIGAWLSSSAATAISFVIMIILFAVYVN